MDSTPWFERSFAKIDDHGRLPAILERLIDAPLRIASRVREVDEDSAGKSLGGKWSVKWEIGHLIDLEPLWYGRVEDLHEGLDELREADLTNAKTHQADHDARELNALVGQFVGLRESLVSKMRSFSDGDIVHSARHPRLKTPMHLVDLAYFVAEHDDHHIEHISRLINTRI